MGSISRGSGYYCLLGLLAFHEVASARDGDDGASGPQGCFSEFRRLTSEKSLSHSNYETLGEVLGKQSPLKVYFEFARRVFKLSPSAAALSRSLLQRPYSGSFDDYLEVIRLLEARPSLARSTQRWLTLVLENLGAPVIEETIVGHNKVIRIAEAHWSEAMPWIFLAPEPQDTSAALLLATHASDLFIHPKQAKKVTTQIQEAIKALTHGRRQIVSLSEEGGIVDASVVLDHSLSFEAALRAAISLILRVNNDSVALSAAQSLARDLLEVRLPSVLRLRFSENPKRDQQRLRLLSELCFELQKGLMSLIN